MAIGAETETRIEEIGPREAAAEIERGGVVLVDTREPHEYQDAHLEGGRLVPPGVLADEIGAAAPDRAARTILYCRSGNRSAIAAAQLQALGYENVASMAGGILAWQEEGLPVLSDSGLSAEQRERYSRHMLMPEVGVDGQLKLLNAKVLLLGAGGLGAPTALYLAAAGIGRIGLVDDDVVDTSNLQRQVIHNTERVGMAKTESARVFIEALNPDVEVVEHRTRLDAENILEIIADYDVIVDGADNFPTRYLLNDASVRLRKPVVSASILSFDGQISTFVPFEGPCYRCLYPTPPPPELAPSCSANGVHEPLSGGVPGATVVVEPLIAGQVEFPLPMMESPGGPLLELRLLWALLSGRQSRRLPVPAFLVRHPGAGPLLVDTGLHPSIATGGGENLGGLANRFGKPSLAAGEDVPSQLRGRGIDPGELPTVVMTHLHLDHSSAISEFPNSTFVVSEAEWRAASHGGLRDGYRRRHFDYAFEYRTVDFDRAGVDSYASFGRTFDLFGDGSLRLAFTPGHSAGHLSLIARLKQRDFVIGGDAFYTLAQLEGEAPLPPRPADAHNLRRSLQELRLFHHQFPDATITPGHDPEFYAALAPRHE